MERPRPGSRPEPAKGGEDAVLLPPDLHRPVYGSETLADVEARCAAYADGLGFDVDCRQTNREGELVDFVQELRHGAGIVINAGAYTHTSVAIRDALATVTCPVVEVHISNVYARERFRHHSYLSAVVTGVIVGLGTQGYELAIQAVAARATTG